jgi:hypothetical protein
LNKNKGKDLEKDEIKMYKKLFPDKTSINRNIKTLPTRKEMLKGSNTRVYDEDTIKMKNSVGESVTMLKKKRKKTKPKKEENEKKESEI